MSGAYAAAMAADRARLESAKKRNLEQASLHGEEDDAVQGAWDSVLRGGQQQAAESEEEARRKKAQRKTEKRNAKRAETAANAGNLSLYVSGIPKELSFNAVQNLFSKAGKVTRCKLYKDAEGENKGDGIVTFASEEGLEAALARDDWNLFGDMLSVSRPTFTTKEAVPKEDWGRIVALKHMFSQEELGAAADYRAYVIELEEEVWRECARLGVVEQVRAFAADPACVVMVRFREVGSAARCISEFGGRWFNERAVVAEEYDGNRKRVLPAEVDEERQARLLPQPRAPAPAPAAAAAASSSAADAAAAAAADAAADAAAAAFAADAVAAAAAAAGPIRLSPSTYVKLRGLVGAAQHNGKVGVVESYDGAAERYTVKLSDGSKLALRQACLLQMLQVNLVGLEGELARHNGQAGTIFDYEPASNTYGVELQEGGEALPVLAANVLLPDGSVAAVHGLQSAPQYNGELAKVLSHDADAARYLVQLGPDGKQLRLKRQNLRA